MGHRKARINVWNFVELARYLDPWRLSKEQRVDETITLYSVQHVCKTTMSLRVQGCGVTALNPSKGTCRKRPANTTTTVDDTPLPKRRRQTKKKLITAMYSYIAIQFSVLAFSTLFEDSPWVIRRFDHQYIFRITVSIIATSKLNALQLISKSPPLLTLSTHSLV